MSYKCPVCGCEFNHKPFSKIVALMRFTHWAKGKVKYYDLRFDKKYRIPENYDMWKKDKWVGMAFRKDLENLWKCLGDYFLCGNNP